MFKLQIIEILDTEGFRHNKDSRQLETCLDVIERNWIGKLEMLVSQIVNVAVTSNNQNRCSG